MSNGMSKKVVFYYDVVENENNLCSKARSR